MSRRGLIAGRVLLADIGGTNARFALMQDGLIGPGDYRKVADYPTIGEAVAATLASHRPSDPVDTAIFAVAGPIANGRCAFTNSPWVVDIAELKQMFGLTRLYLLNDFEAVGWSLPALTQADLYPLGPQQALAGAPMVVFGAGTGFGAACFVPHGVSGVVVVTEAGHATLPALSDREAAVLQALRHSFGHVSIERVLSGSGLQNLYHAIATVDGVAAPARDPGGITAGALDGSCDLCRTTLDMFCNFMGSVAGNLALTFSARGGIYIAGGIVPRFADHLAGSGFRRQFEDKGRFRSFLEQIPTAIVTHPDPGFVGLRHFFIHHVTNEMAGREPGQ